MSDKLTKKQEAFVDYYFKTGEDGGRFNGLEAARLAGYRGNDNTLMAIASQNLTKLKIKAAIEERMKPLKMAADDVISALAEMAQSSMEDFITIDWDSGGNPKLDLAKATARGQMHLVKAISWKDGQISRIELYDKQAALDKLARVHGLYNDKLTLNFDWEATFRKMGLDPQEMMRNAVNALATGDRTGVPSILQ